MALDNRVLLKAAAVGAGAGLVISVLSMIPCIGAIVCCLSLFLYMAVGASYGYFSEQAGGQPDLGNWALGGGIAGAAAGLLASLVRVAGALVVQALGLGAATAAQMQQLEQLEQAGLPPEVVSQLTGAGASLGMVVMGACIGFILIMILGAAGGALYAAYKGNQSRTVVPPAV
ncbi:MAG: hypothetical protein IT326_08755 [Anaerolineae bacterium]|nr:hypothetical protein [Anaerolineae bacterium]